SPRRRSPPRRAPRCGSTRRGARPRPRDAVVRDVVVTDKREEPVVAGTAFLVPAAARNEDGLTFDLDAPFPLARSVGNGVDQGAYFTTRRVVVPALGRTALPLRLAAARAAHTFTLSLTYDCAGRSLAIPVDDEGRRFAVSPMARRHGRVFVVERTDDGLLLVPRPTGG
ncbi:hypothetical protein ACFXGA_38780, partial [Actinosynnema sp. NPDC059335]|uniref:hypothetical protein n=1 Tax=Actinosynnema sp. NPDC059335 TaxID=3346804 RepID=UPI00367005E1